MKILFTTLLSFISMILFAQTGEQVIAVSKALFVPEETKTFVPIGDRNIIIKKYEFGTGNNIICINLHDNEGTSVEAARSVLEEKGGTLIKIENARQRVIKFRLKGVTYGFDPNRMFSRIGIEQTLRDNRRYSFAALLEVEKFAAQVLAMIPDTVSCVIALHNNTEEAYSVKSYLPGRERQWDARAVYADSTQDVDDIAFTTDSLLYQRMADSGYNSIWQHNERVKKDGSLSVHFGLLNKRYINIETQHGKVKQYEEMLFKLMMILQSEKEKEIVAGIIE